MRHDWCMVHNLGGPEGRWPWPRPSERIVELMRLGAERALEAPPEWLAELDGATFDRERMKHLAEDPVLAAAIRRTTRANVIHWAAANVRDPGAPVAPNLGPEPLAVAHDLVRRGLRESALDGYRVGQNIAWLRWMEIAFQLTRDPEELRQLLELSGRSIAWFIDATIAGIAEHMEAEREELTRGTQAERREVVALLLEGAPISVQSASHRLGYLLEQTHRAAVIWSDEAESELRALESVADALARSVGAQRPLIVVAGVATLWAWVPGKSEPDTKQLKAAVHSERGVRIAIGSHARGVEGFRRSHLDALTAQRMLTRLQSSERVVSFDEVRLVSLVTQDAEAAKAFVQHTLGELASAAPEQQQALWMFLRAGCNASQAAEVLRTHRNTLLRRLTRAESLLPRPLEDQRTHVAVALEVLRWQRASADSATE
jgi:DNA-binding PucR family transcriptional regulator